MSWEESAEARHARSILTHYWGEVAARDVFFRGIRGGFSGSRVWRVELPDASVFFLKHYPQSGVDLNGVHFILRELLRLQGFTSNPSCQIAAPVADRNGLTVYAEADGFWDLTPEVQGRARRPEEVQLSEIALAMQSVAHLHLALAWVGEHSPYEWCQKLDSGKSQNLRSRRARLAEVIGKRAVYQSKLVNLDCMDEIKEKCVQIVRRALPHAEDLVRVTGWEDVKLPIQPCVRDLWFAHVLFDGSKSVGFIDFAALGSDCVATDLARLLRSWFPEDNVDFEPMLEAYHAVRPLTGAERESFGWFDRTSRVLSAFQWVEWLAIENRDFDDWATVSERLDFVLARLPPPR
jgi:hypothetical protein